MRWVLVTAAVLMAGFAGALYEASRQARPPAGPPETLVAREPRAVAKIDDRQLDDLVERLAARIAARQPEPARQPQGAAPAKEAPAAEPAPEPTPEQLAAAGQAGEIVEAAIA